MKKILFVFIAAGVILPLMTNAGNAEDYRFPRVPGATKDGYPLPLSGEPITKTPVIGNKQDVAANKYP